MSLPRSSPSEQGVDPAAVLAVIDAWEADPEIEMHSLMVVRHGHVVAEGWWAPYAPTRRHLLYSISKSFTATALGLAIAEGLLDVEDRVLSHLPELASVGDERTRSLTVRHLASMASGHDRDTWQESAARDPQDPVRGFLSIPPDADPGSLFAYNQPCTLTIARILERVTGASLTDYLRPRLLDPLGIADVGWTAWPGGPQLGFTGLHAGTEDVAKLGLLYLQRGVVGDHRLLPAGWVDAATSFQVDTAAAQPNPDWQQGYGFCFWQARHGYRGDGAFGQFCVVLPEHDTVVATTGGTEAMQSVLDVLWTHLLPGLGVSAAPSSSERALDERLAGLRLAPPEVSGAIPGSAIGSYEARSSELSSVTVENAGDTWSVLLEEPDNALSVRFDAGDWAVTEPVDRTGATIPVAASSGWADGSLRVDIVFLETAHTLELTLVPEDRSAVPSWRTQPFHGTALHLMHSP